MIHTNNILKVQNITKSTGRVFPGTSSSTFYMQYATFCIIFTTFFFLHSTNCQTLTLEQVIHYTQANSPEAMKVKTSKENKYWQWKTYKSEYRPQLVLNSIVPSYQNKNMPVIQDDGSVVYRNINQSLTSTGLTLEQNIGFTGGKISLSSDLNRLDDFRENINSYNGSPVFISFEQPLFSFNNLKWMHRIEPLKYEESLKEYIEGNERIAYNTTYRFFNLLISQVKYQIALTNKANADTIYKIGQERYNMGKISKNELLQLKFGVISAKKFIGTTELSIKTSRLELLSYTGLTPNENMALRLPNNIARFHINDSLALRKALENSKRSVEFKREILEAKRNSEKARRESKLNANLFVSYGQTNIAHNVKDVYENPKTLQTLNVGLTLPLLDGGRAKATRKTAEANLKLVEFTVKQKEINFRQEVFTETENFRMLRDFIEYNTEADQTATERYEIARLRYLAGNISLTEYNIALEEKDRAKQDYITALRNYWLTYYLIRILTLYDFENNKQLLVN